MSEVRAGSSRFELLPCPFCGGEAHIVTAVGESWALCGKCRATTEMHASKQFAVAAWNRRADHD